MSREQIAFGVLWTLLFYTWIYLQVQIDTLRARVRELESNAKD